jgi:hypothetical protein
MAETTSCWSLKPHLKTLDFEELQSLSLQLSAHQTQDIRIHFASVKPFETEWNHGILNRSNLMNDSLSPALTLYHSEICTMEHSPALLVTETRPNADVLSLSSLEVYKGEHC